MIIKWIAMMVSKLKKFLVNIVRLGLNFLNIISAYRLKNYNTSIESVQKFNDHNASNKYAIFIYYEPDGGVSKSALNILASLKLASVNSIVVCNHNLSEKQINCLGKYAHKVIIRRNQGADFGGYKDAVDYLNREGVMVERLGFLNDSVYYFSRGIDEFVENLFNFNGVSAAFENWQKPHKYHLQSFAICVNETVFNSPSFSNFWKNYRPVNSRIHAIENGEKLLTESIVKSSPKINIIYNIQHLIDRFDEFDLDVFDLKSAFPTALTHFISNDLEIEKNHRNGKTKTDVINAISAYSPIHTGARFFIHLGCPLLKKDMVYRMGFSAWKVENICSGAFDDAEVNEFMSIIRKKGNAYSLSFFKRILFSAGVI